MDLFHQYSSVLLFAADLVKQSSNTLLKILFCKNNQNATLCANTMILKETMVYFYHILDEIIGPKVCLTFQ